MADLLVDVLEELERRGLLLQQDRTVPSVVTLVGGEPLRASWWSHPRAQAMFAVLSELAEHPDVLFTKLVQGKVTLVHRRLWPALLAVVQAGESWQRRGLPSAARKLLARVEEEGSVQASGPVVKEIERRCLARATQIHTERGHHVLVLESWETWRRRAKVRAWTSVDRGRQCLEDAAGALGALPSSLPWHPRRSSRG